jgi:hypothetical protein
MKDKNTTTEQTAENSLPPKLAATLERIEAEGCESSRRVWELATWDCTPDEAHVVVAAWEAKRAKAAELARATETAKETQPATKAEPAQDADPDFQFLGIPRRLWGPMTAAAYKAEAAAVSAETALAAAEDRLRERREELARVEAELVNATEDAAVANAVANAASEDIDRATSREERDTRKEEAAKAAAEAKTASERASEIRQHAETARNSVPFFTGDAERTRASAHHLRAAADAAAKRATEQELPKIREDIARAETAKRAERELEKLCAARSHLVRVTCRECRFWEPEYDRAGTCHARPPSGSSRPTVSAVDWCALGETIPPPTK